MNRKNKKFFNFIGAVLIAVVLFNTADFVLSEIADLKAYEDAVAVSSDDWSAVESKIEGDLPLTDDDYSLIFSQTGLGKPAVDRLISEDNTSQIDVYREYYIKDKDYKCVREGVFACHEYVTDSKGNPVSNPPFADIRNGDIILTLSIHSLGWRHGHAAIVTDAEKGQTVQAVMMGKKSDYGTVEEWSEYPLVAVLRAKNDGEAGQEIADFTDEKLRNIDYSFFPEIGNEGNLNSTHCAHLVWYAYNKFGIDIDSNGGKTVTPYEILRSGELETVQVYGNINAV